MGHARKAKAVERAQWRKKQKRGKARAGRQYVNCISISAKGVLLEAKKQKRRGKRKAGGRSCRREGLGRLSRAFTTHFPTIGYLRHPPPSGLQLSLGSPGDFARRRGKRKRVAVWRWALNATARGWYMHGQRRNIVLPSAFFERCTLGNAGLASTSSLPPLDIDYQTCPSPAQT